MNHPRVPKGQGYRVQHGQWHVYTAYDDAGAALYVGITRSLHGRLTSHKSSPWFAQAAWIGVHHFEDADEAIRAELRAIEEQHPPYNTGRQPYAATFPDSIRYESEIRFIPVVNMALAAHPPRPGRPRTRQERSP